MWRCIRAVGSKSRVLIGLFHNLVVWKADWVAGLPPPPSSYSHHSLKWPSHFAVLVLDAGSGTRIWGLRKEGGDPTRSFIAYARAVQPGGMITLLRNPSRRGAADSNH